MLAYECVLALSSECLYEKLISLLNNMPYMDHFNTLNQWLLLNTL